MDNPIEITPRAVEEIKNILTKKGIPPDYSLRIGVKGGSGCGGASFFLGFDKPKEGDECYTVEGINILIEKRQLLYVIGVKLDFEERKDERGFVFEKT